MSKNNGLGEVTNKNILLRKGFFRGITAVKHANGKDIWILSKHNRDSFYTYLFTKSGILPTAVKSYAQQFKTDEDTLLQYGAIKFSSDGKLLAECYLTNGNKQLGAFSTFNLFDFDRNNGLVSNKRVIDSSSRRGRTSVDKMQHSFTDLAFSPSDSLIYLVENYNPAYGGPAIVQYDRYANDISSSKYVIKADNQIGANAIQLANNGRIYIGNSSDYFSVIYYPDNHFQNCMYIGKYIKMNSTPSIFYSFGNPFYSYERVKFRLITNCKYIYTKNLSDTSVFKKFTWYLSDKDSQQGYNIRFQYKSSGYHLLKLKAENDYGYAVWYSDSLYFKKGISASFTYNKDTGCQWLGYQFTNTTDFDSNSLPLSYIWDFGDNTSDTSKNPIHIFKRSGKFKITLFAFDGICTDTFSSLQDIVILSAPRPGFSVSVKQGCAPLSVQVADQSTGTVQHRMFTSTNGQSDTNTNATFLYTKAGDYIIHQYLKGPTGCITEDSVSIHVIQPFVATDSLRLLQLSIDSAGLFIKWKPYEHVYAYDIYRKDDKLDWLLQEEVTDTMYRDPGADYHRNRYQYYIRVVDSCNSVSEQGLPSGNILLQAMYKSRQNIQLNWNSYQGWQHGVARYELERKTDSASKYSVLSASANSGLTDDGMELAGQTYACYRIHAFEQAGNYRESYSNEVCLKLQPLYWIPNAFTPNKQGPGENETFKVTGYGLRDFELQVMNRSWNVVFDSHDINQGWDGTYKGQLLPEGQYIYVMNAQSEDGFIHKIGSVDLIR
jgi:gliding motility-associated-like protein